MGNTLKTIRQDHSFIVGGNPSKEAIKRFEIVREAVGKDITLYTCDEKGKLITLL